MFFCRSHDGPGGRVGTLVFVTVLLAACSSEEATAPVVKSGSPPFEEIRDRAAITEADEQRALTQIYGLVTGVGPADISYVRGEFSVTELPDGAELGLGTPVADGRFLLTAHHVVDGEAGEVVVLGRGVNAEVRTTAEHFWCFPADDLAILMLHQPLNAGFDFAASPGVGDTVWTWGRFEPKGGVVLETPRPSPGRSAVVATSISGVYGDSGGPLLDATGALVAVTVGARRSRKGTENSVNATAGIAIRPAAALIAAVISGRAEVGSYNVTDCVDNTATQVP